LYFTKYFLSKKNRNIFLKKYSKEKWAMYLKNEKVYTADSSSSKKIG